VESIDSLSYHSGYRPKEWQIKEYIIKIPTQAKKSDLQDLKTFLESQIWWDTKVFIDLKWQKIDTKIYISNLDNVVLWEKNKWKI
jgi:hypothetical protein